MNIKQRIRKECGACGKPIFVLPSGVNKKYCSNICRWKSRSITITKNCPECGVEFIPKIMSQKCCSQSCGRKQQAKTLIAIAAPKRVKRYCGYCGKEYRKKHLRKTIFCSRECAFLYQGKNLRIGGPRILWRSGISGRGHEIRAKQFGVQYDRFKPIDIFERDNYTCRICGDKINKYLKYPDPLCVSLDHVIPLSRGGEHTKENTRAAHLICNMKKSDSVFENKQSRDYAEAV